MEALAARLAAAADAPDRRARFIASIKPIYSDAPVIRANISRRTPLSTTR